MCVQNMLCFDAYPNGNNKCTCVEIQNITTNILWGYHGGISWVYARYSTKLNSICPYVITRTVRMQNINGFSSKLIKWWMALFSMFFLLEKKTKCSKGYGRSLGNMLGVKHQQSSTNYSSITNYNPVYGNFKKSYIISYVQVHNIIFQTWLDSTF